MNDITWDQHLGPFCGQNVPLPLMFSIRVVFEINKLLLQAVTALDVEKLCEEISNVLLAVIT